MPSFLSPRLYFVHCPPSFGLFDRNAVKRRNLILLFFNSLRFLHALRLVEMTLLLFLSYFPNSRTTAESGVIFVRAKARCYLYFLSFRIVPTKCSVSVHFRLVGKGGVQPYAKQLSFTESNCAFLGCDDALVRAEGAPLYAVAFTRYDFLKALCSLRKSL